MIFIEKNQATCRDLFKNLTDLENKHKNAMHVIAVKFMVINAEFVKADGMDFVPQIYFSIKLVK